MGDYYISKENTLKNIGLLNVSVLMGNNKEVDKAIGGYNPSSFLAGLSYGLEQVMGMISSQSTLDEKEIIRKAMERIVERLKKKIQASDTKFDNIIEMNAYDDGVDDAIEIVKKEGGIE